ncbi:hypothetical protein [Metabacillus idriensis]|uniref:hypothetical protein n=1 Tax=Metabacillus idriensis TaxID=324768 RepID=UPI003D26ECFB
MSKFWQVNLITLIITALLINGLLLLLDNLNFIDFLIGFSLTTGVQFLVSLFYLTLRELKGLSLNFSMLFGIVLIFSSIVIVIFGWDKPQYLLHNTMVSISLVAYGLSLKDLVDLVDEDKEDSEKYFKGWITMVIVGFIAFMVVAVQPIATFVNETNTDLFTLISLGLVLVTISVKQNIYNLNNRPFLPPLKLDIKKSIKELSKEENNELEEHIKEFLRQKNKL